MAHFTLRPAAERDLDQIEEYIGSDNPIRAVKFIDELEGYLQRLAEGPLLLQLAPIAGPNVRRAVFGTYLIFYEATEYGIDVIRVIEGHRDLAKQHFSSED